MDFFNFFKFSKDVPLYPEKIIRKQLAIKDDNTVMRFIGTNSRPYVTIIFVIEDVMFIIHFTKYIKIPTFLMNGKVLKIIFWM